MNDMVDAARPAARRGGGACQRHARAIRSPCSVRTTPRLGRVVRAFLPGALAVEVLARAGGDAARPAGAGRAARAVRRSGRQRRALSAAHRLAGRGAGDRGSLFLRPAARRARSAPVQRRAAFRTRLAPRRQLDDDRRRARRALRRVGAERARGVGGRRLQHLGPAAPPDAAALSRPACGNCSSRGSAAGARYKFAIVGPDGVRLPLKADPLARATEPPPATASVVVDPHAARLARRGVDAAARAQRHATDAPISIYEVHAASWFHPDGRIPNWDELAERLVPYVSEMGFTPCRADAGGRASVRRLVGLSAARPVRAERAVRAARGLRPLRRCLPPRRYRRHRRLGAGAFPDRCAWPGAVRRHRAVRARRIRARASTRTGTPTSTISAAARCRAS